MRVETRIYGSGWTVSFILTVMAGQEPVKAEVERSVCGALSTMIQPQVTGGKLIMRKQS